MHLRNPDSVLRVGCSCSVGHAARVEALLAGMDDWIKEGYTRPLWTGADTIAQWVPVMVLKDTPVTTEEVTLLRRSVSEAEQRQSGTTAVRAWLFRHGATKKLESMCSMLEERVK